MYIKPLADTPENRAAGAHLHARIQAEKAAEKDAAKYIAHVQATINSIPHFMATTSFVADGLLEFNEIDNAIEYNADSGCVNKSALRSVVEDLCIVYDETNGEHQFILDGEYDSNAICYIEQKQKSGIEVSLGYPDVSDESIDEIADAMVRGFVEMAK